MIELRDVKKSYKNSEALKGIDLKICDGEITILRGKSGSGKSTILSLIAGFLYPTSGEVVVNAQNITMLNSIFLSRFRARNIGFIYQSPNLIEGFTLFENIALPLLNREISHKEITKKVLNLLNKIGLEDRKDDNISTLSGGEAQRVAFARAVVHNPKIIIADEPSANLDEENSLELIRRFEDLKRSDRVILIATHDELFFNRFDKDYLIKDGKIV